MKTLLRKDWRNNATALIGGAVLLAAPYLLALVAIITWWGDYKRQGRSVHQAIAVAGHWSLWLTAILAAVFGGAAFALERRERSADFLAMMPVPRSRIIASKALVAVVCLTLMWLVNATIVIASSRASHTHWNHIIPPIVLPASAAVMLFGIAWLISTFLSSPALAASISIGVTVGSWALLALIVGQSAQANTRSDEIMTRLFHTWALFAGVAAFAAGCAYYVRRVAP